MAYAVDESASEAKIAKAVFLVSLSCAKRAVLIGLPVGPVVDDVGAAAIANL